MPHPTQHHVPPSMFSCSRTNTTTRLPQTVAISPYLTMFSVSLYEFTSCGLSHAVLTNGWMLPRLTSNFMRNTRSSSRPFRFVQSVLDVSSRLSSCSHVRSHLIDEAHIMLEVEDPSYYVMRGVSKLLNLLRNKHYRLRMC